jgi:hypothetical protein
MGRVPQVRPSVPEPKKTGEAHNSFHSIDQQIPGGVRKDNRNISSSAQVRLANLGHPSCFL